MNKIDLAIRRKIKRLKGGSPPRFMDLFGGCGGITLGFVTAGFELVASVESDNWAAASHGANFSAFSRGTSPEAHSKARDIVRETPGSIFRDLGVAGHVEEQVDVLVGGPPCQAFARVGRAKLRHEAQRRDDTDGGHTISMPTTWLCTMAPLGLRRRFTMILSLKNSRNCILAFL